MKMKLTIFSLLICTLLAHAGPGGEKGGASGGNGGGGFWLCNAGAGYAPVDEIYPIGSHERMRFDGAGESERNLMGCFEFGMSGNQPEE